MKTKIIKQDKNPFLDRDDLVLEIENESTPSFSEVKAEIGKDENLIVVKKIGTSFGKQKVIVDAVVYNSVEAKERIETIPKKIRKKIEEERKAKEDAAKKEAEEKLKESSNEAEKTDDGGSE